MPRSCPPLHPDLGMSGMSWDLSRTLWAEMYRGLRGQFSNCSELYQVWPWIWWSASIPGILASIYNLQGERKQVCFPPQKLQRSSKHQAISCHQITHCNQALHPPTSLDHFHPAACAPASHAWDHRHSFGICPKAQINGPTRRGCWIVQRVFLCFLDAFKHLQTGDGNSTNMLSR